MSLDIYIWDVQHGLANYINTPNDTRFVHDLGSWSSDGPADGSPLQNLKDNHGINNVDQVFITHPHKDHIDDILNLDEITWRYLRRPTHLTKEEILEGVREEDMDLFEKYFEIGTAYSDGTSSSSSSSDKPTNPDNNGGVDVDIFSPTSCSTSNLDNHSLVIVLSYASSKFVLAGDNRPAALNELMDKKRFERSVRNSDILLAPHHGTESAYHPEFVDLVNPRITVVSAGSYDPDTSATSDYSDKSRGWTVHHRDDSDSEKRYCVTTRKNGYVKIRAGYNDDKPFLAVTID